MIPLVPVTTLIKVTLFCLVLWYLAPSVFFQLAAVAGRAGLHIVKIVLDVLGKIVEQFL